MSQLFTSGGQSIGVSASVWVLPMNTQDSSPLGWTGPLQSKGLSRVFSNTTVQKHQFFGVQLSSQSLSHPYRTTGKSIALTRWTFVGKVMSLLFNMLSRLVITFLPRSKRLDLVCSLLIDCDLGEQNEHLCAVPSHSESASTSLAASQNCCEDLKSKKKCECKTTQLKRSLQRDWDVECSGEVWSQAWGGGEFMKTWGKEARATPPSLLRPPEHCPVWVPAWPSAEQAQPCLAVHNEGAGHVGSGQLHDQTIVAPWQAHRTENSVTRSWGCELSMSSTSIRDPTVCPQGQLFLDFCLHLRSGY